MILCLHLLLAPSFWLSLNAAVVKRKECKSILILEKEENMPQLGTFFDTIWLGKLRLRGRETILYFGFNQNTK